MSLEGRIQTALGDAVSRLLGMINEEGFWEGHLSSSALSTATALSALSGAGAAEDLPLIEGGLAWLAATQNADGGWGDTPDSPSNLSTSILVMCAMRLAGGRLGPGIQAKDENDFGGEQLTAQSSGTGILARDETPWPAEAPQITGKDARATKMALARMEAYITERAGATPQERVSAICAIYGKDRTFAAPILMNCALAGLVPWSDVPPLPFELALCPRALYKALRLHVVSYALPALIAVGALIHKRNPAANPFQRALRNMAIKRVLGNPLISLQPASGGFLEATPLTSFVTMSLIPLAGPEHPVAAKGLGFLRRSFREDGSWPIDTNLATWVTTAAIGALSRARELKSIAPERTGRWIAARQWREVHPFTGAAPGGFAWTHLSGGVPDADDTAGAILALAKLGLHEPLRPAIEWLLALQNSDGGWPTFCRGWGKLPFDQSAPDLTAHVLRALLAIAPGNRPARVAQALRRGFLYLRAKQRGDGAWIPLWFGNQHAPRHENPVLGTARVLLAWAAWNPGSPNAKKGVKYLLRAQNPDGGWGGAPEVASTVEETALVVAALARFPRLGGVREAMLAGVDYLLERIDNDTWTRPAPIGLYFASLWYSEALYPVIWTVEALGTALDFLRNGTNPEAEATFLCFR